MDLLAQIIATVIQIEVLLIFVRILVSWFPGVDQESTPMRFLRAFVDPVLAPFRKIPFTKIGGMDFSALLAIFVLIEVSNFIQDLLLAGYASVPLAILHVLYELVITVVSFMAIGVFLRVAMKFLHANPANPAANMINKFTDPIVKPMRWIQAGRAKFLDMPGILMLIVFFLLYTLTNTAYIALATQLTPQ